MAPKARILIADDEPHIRRILQFLLEKEGFEVQLAADGKVKTSVSRRAPLSEAAKVLDELDKGKYTGRAIINDMTK